MQINLCCNECPALLLPQNTFILLAIYLLCVPLISPGKNRELRCSSKNQQCSYHQETEEIKFCISPEAKEP